MPVLAALAFAAVASTAPGADCAALYRTAVQNDLDLPVDVFDQTEGRGFRVLAAAGCPREAGDLIQAWSARREVVPYHVHWHLAQVRAEQDDRPAAIAAARRALRSDEAVDAPFRWNDYVLATVAFLQRDRAAFERHRNAVAAAVERHAGNGMNLSLLDKLGKHFDSSYLEAQRAGRTP